MKCDKHISQCTCSDMNDRLRAVAQSGVLAYKKCTICDKHYALCKCENPQWGIEYNPKRQESEAKNAN